MPRARTSKVYRGYSNSRGDRNQASTAGQAYYTTKSNGSVNKGNANKSAQAGDPDVNPSGAFHGRRMMTTKGQKVNYTEDRRAGKGVQYGDQVLVSRDQQRRAIKTAVRNAEKDAKKAEYTQRLIDRGMSEADAAKRAKQVVNRTYAHRLLAG